MPAVSDRSRADTGGETSRKRGARSYGLGLGVVAGLSALLLAGCAAPPEKEAQAPTRLVWPAPPQKPRIQFVRSLVSEADLGQDTTFSQQVLNLLAGMKPPAKRISEPMGIAVSDDGQRIYVSAFNRNAVFVFDFSASAFRTIEPLAHPVGVALDGDENLYVVEQQNRKIAVFDRAGKRVRSISHPDIERPGGIAIDRTRGRLYVADTGRSEQNSKTNKGHSVKVFDLQGNLLRTIGGGRGSAPGQLLFPTYVAVDRSGNVYVSDTLNARVEVFDPEGNYLRKFGERGNAWGMFDKPKGVALDSFGNLYVADSGWSNVQIFNQKGQVLLFFGGRGPIPGMLKNPTAVTIDASNRIFVGDYINHRVNVYQLLNTTAEDSFQAAPSAGTQAAGTESTRARLDKPVRNPTGETQPRPKGGTTL